MFTASINLATLAAVSIASGKEATRFYLQGVHVEVSPRAVIYVVTDGHRAIVAREELAKDAEDNTLLGAFTIPADSCKALKAPRHGSPLATLSCEETTIENGKGVAMTLAVGGTSHGFKTIEYPFPGWRCVLPTSPLYGKEEDFAERSHAVTFNPVYLADFAKIAKAMDLGCKTPHLVRNGDGPAFVWFGDREDVFGVIMPCRSRDMRGRAAPSWVHEAPTAPELQAAE